MRKESLYCDYCQKPTTIEGKLKEKLNGFLIEVGYSIGGWGSRRDLISNSSVEICTECFNKVSEKVKEIKLAIEQLKCPQKRNANAE